MRSLFVSLLAMAALASPARPQAVLSLADGAAGDELGAAVSPAYDADQDGVADFLVGSPGASAQGADSGRVALVSGATGATLAQRDGPAALSRFGASIARLIDYDGDGAPEFAVGAPGTGGASPAGAVHLIDGATLATLHVFQGPSPQARLGRRVIAIDDQTGDQVPEIAASAPGFDNGLVFGAGGVFVYDGATTQLIRLFTGAQAFDGFGECLDRVGDLGGDGRSELVVGSPGADPGGVIGAGQAAILDPVSGAVLRVFTGAAMGEAFGQSCAGVLDIDGDQSPEVLVGAPVASPGGVLFAGRAALLNAATGTLLAAFSGAQANDQLGATVAGLGDVDRDGFGDFAVGSPTTKVSGLSGAGRVTVFSGQQGMLWRFEGTQANAGFGAVVRALGDVDHDGRQDFAIGSPGFDVGGADAGRVEIRRGMTAALTIDSTGKLGSPYTIALHATPFSLVVLLIGAQPGSVPSPFGEICLALAPSPIVLALPPTSANGMTMLSGSIPPVLPPNTTYYAQCLVSDAVGAAGFLTSECAVLTVVP